MYGDPLKFKKKNNESIDIIEFKLSYAKKKIEFKCNNVKIHFFV